MARGDGRGTRAPAPGRYGGTVDGNPAVFGVTADVVCAWWIVPHRARGFTTEANAWDVEADGGFRPAHGGSPVRCRIGPRAKEDVAGS